MASMYTRTYVHTYTHNTQWNLLAKDPLNSGHLSNEEITDCSSYCPSYERKDVLKIIYVPFEMQGHLSEACHKLSLSSLD